LPQAEKSILMLNRPLTVRFGMAGNLFQAGVFIKRNIGDKLP